ncbi:MAG: HD domain-containing phosphohydrolase [Planctomycetaceae bacterium]
MTVKTGHITVSLSEFSIGIVLPSDVVDVQNSGMLLLSKGIPVTEQLLTRLKERGINRVAVDAKSAAVIRGARGRSAPRSPAKNPPAAAPEKPRDRVQRPKTPLPPKAKAKELQNCKAQQKQNLEAVFQSVRNQTAPSAALTRAIISESVNQIQADIDVFLKVALENSEASELHEHCLAASQLAMSVGLMEGLSEQAIQDLGAGCILSRIGQSAAATQFARQMRELGVIEMLDLQRTPSRTFDFLQNMRDVSVGARSVAYQIFERFDGSGYPRGRAGNQISPLARLAAVCDVYVALTSPRPHRGPYEPYAAVEMLIHETRAKKFDPLAMRALLRTIGLFPIGSFVRLSDGQIGQVVRNHREKYDQPVVHIFRDSYHTCVREDQSTLDLSQVEGLRVISAISSDAMQRLMAEAIVPDAPAGELPFVDAAVEPVGALSA